MVEPIEAIVTDPPAYRRKRVKVKRCALDETAMMKLVFHIICHFVHHRDALLFLIPAFV